ncbi:MAG TPA: TonB-dependent receptor [Gemmatimonadaceae bacterium]|nr:TonB-dependent receptor [Gemmatimonadaceae bacterium]
MQRTVRRHARTLTSALLALCLFAPRARATHDIQQPCARATSGPAMGSEGWPAPLDRLVSLDSSTMTLHAALDHVAQEARVRLVYSPDLLPLDRPACAPSGTRTLGDVLVTLLTGTMVSPVIGDADQVVLAPARGAIGAAATPEAARTTASLERIVVTGSATGAPERAAPYAITVLDGATLPRTGTSSIASLLDGAVPGVWAWAQSPTNVLLRYGGIRGASSFGVSAPKVYVDGIEVANPLVLTSLDPSQVERVEVIRGPQGAALYGADAISGVVNIVMRHDGASSGEVRTEVRVSAGSSASSYSTNGILTQDHALSIRSGSAARSASLGIALSTLGPVTPSASSRKLLVTGGLRHVGSRLIVTGTARFDGANSLSTANPILLASLPGSVADSAVGTQRVRQYTLGGTATYQAQSWTHSLTVGVDGYRLAGTDAGSVPLPSPADSALRAARGGADRLTLRYSGTRRLGEGNDHATEMTFGLEHSTARERSSGFDLQLAPRVADDPYEYEREGSRGDALQDAFAPRRELTAANEAGVPVTSWWSNTGAFGQAQLSLGSALSVTGGGRLEYMSGPSVAGQFALLPMLGTAWVHALGPATLKLRAAYGRGIRPARTVARGATWNGGESHQLLASLASEEQSGVESGADFLWGSRVALHVTRFDQRASGLVQPVARLWPVDDAPTAGSPERARVQYELQNVGAITNDGWELAASSVTGPLVLTGTLTLVDSRVARVANGYAGDLQVGDRMLEVPARTAGVQARWTSARWEVRGSLSRAYDWVNYDEIALAKAVASDPTGQLLPVGTALRAYWKSYPGSTHADGGMSLALHDRLWLDLTGLNLLGQQVGEPDNISVVPGRTLRLGLRNVF